MNVVDLSDRSWNRLLQNADRYVPIVERLIAFYLLHDHRTNEDHDPFGHLARETVPGLKDLSDFEQEFVVAGAMQVYYQDDPSYEIREHIRAWVADGGPS